ncbi:hypothetical protein RCH09_002120 [Actimicrobium sp. GrIS 1.19]|uniref:PEP-CTERM sorting domain-containing protein n=1 Tax=Actimicrobium sp. GrIS 1.19 TaxID=3071708 RepID=UPI002DFC1847|nr:hypothetical protein [Actimicrobium sp. GrIS 1.19]
MKPSLNHALLASLLSTVCFTAGATAVVPQTTTSPVDLVDGGFGGTLLNFVATPVSTPSYSGTARSAVYDNGNGLDFYYQFVNNPGSQSSIERLTGFNYGNLAVDAFQTANSFGPFSTGTQSSDSVDRGAFGVIGFNFLPLDAAQILAGSTTNLQILRTNARAYTNGAFGILDGFAANGVGFAPDTGSVPAVPEPEPWALIVIGIGMVAYAVRRKKGVSGYAMS